MKEKKFKKVYVIIMLVLFLVGFLHSETQPQQPSNYSDSDAGTEANPYLISNLANLRWMSEVSDDWWKGENVQVHFKQTADIDASETIVWNQGYGIRPIGHQHGTQPFITTIFCGIYDGGNYMIFNIFSKFPRPNTALAANISLFVSLVQSTIKNLHLVNFEISFNEPYTGLTNAGGIAGTSSNSTIINCSVTGQINANVFNAIVGGIAGRLLSSSSIQNSYSDVDITLNTVDIGFNTITGGIVGESIWGSNITNSYSKGNIMVDDLIVGGIVGRMQRTSIQNCYSVGNILVADSDSIIGGIAGRHESNTYYPNSTIIGSFWDIETTSVSEALGFNHQGMCDIENTYGLTTIEMKQASTFINNAWDFIDVWDINPFLNDGYPFLRGMPGFPDEIILPPTDFTAIVEGNTVILSWVAPESNPLGYNLYRDDDLLIPDLLVDTTFTDYEVPVGLYFYSLKAIYQTGESEAVTIEVEILPEVFLPPTDFIAIIEGNTVILSWVAPESNPMGYNLYRGDILLNTNLLTDTSYIIYEVPIGVHLFSLYAIYPTGSSEAVTVEVEILPEVFLPPTDFIAIIEGNTVILSWVAPESNPLGYNLYRGDILLNTTLLIDTSCILYEVPVGVHLFSLYAIYTTGSSEAVTVEVEILPEVFLPPTEFTASVEDNNVILSWLKPESEPLGYGLYRGEMPLHRSLILETTYVDYDVPEGNHVYSLQAIYENGESEMVYIEIEIKVSDGDINDVPILTELVGNFPNPFNPITTIKYNLAVESMVRIDIFNIRGQLVKTLVNEYQVIGRYTEVWHADDVPSGIYLYRLETSAGVEVKRMVLLK